MCALPYTVHAPVSGEITPTRIGPAAEAEVMSAGEASATTPAPVALRKERRDGPPPPNFLPELFISAAPELMFCLCLAISAPHRPQAIGGAAAGQRAIEHRCAPMLRRLLLRPGVG